MVKVKDRKENKRKQLDLASINEAIKVVAANEMCLLKVSNLCRVPRAIARTSSVT